MASERESIARLLDQVVQQGQAWKEEIPGAREDLMNTSSKLFSALSLPGESIALTQWAQPSHNACIHFGCEIQLFEALAEGNGKAKSSKTIADMTNPRTEHTLVARMLRLLGSMNTVIEVEPDVFAPSRFARELVREDYKDTVALMQGDLQPMMTKQPEYFKKIGYKNPSSSVDAAIQYALDSPGQHLFELFAKWPMMGKRFANMMQVWSEDRPKWFQEGYYPVEERLIKDAVTDDPETQFLVDVGGGSGHDVKQFMEAFGDSISGTVVLQDRPEIIAIAEKDTTFPPRITRMAHDFLTEQPIKGARAYYFHSIMQDWNDETCQQVLRSIIPAMKQGYSKILLNEYIIPSQGAHFLETGVDWELMATLSARHRTEEEMLEMIEGAGLKIVQIFKHKQGIDSLIEVDLQ